MTETTFYGEVVPIQPKVSESVDTISQTLPPEPPAPGEGPPSWIHMTPEQKWLSQDVLGISGNNGWWLGTGEKDQTAPRRRLYAMNDRCRCEHCGGGDSAVPWIETHLHMAGRGCLNPNCGFDKSLGSLLYLELNRLPKNAIVSEFQGYVADDPLMDHVPLWEPGVMFHNGGRMGSGKTYHMIQRAIADPDGIYIFNSPRKALTYSTWIEFSRALGMRAGLYYGGSPRQYRNIESRCVCCTLPSLPWVLYDIRRMFGTDIPPIYIFLDELDFCSELMLSNILRHASPEIRDLLHQIVERNGIVTAGQTEWTATLELNAAELGIDPDENLWSYHNQPQPNGQIAEIREYPNVPGKKNMVIAGVVDLIREGLAQRIPQYAHGDGRRSAQVIASFFQDSQLFDKYHRGIEQNRDLLRRGRLDDESQLFVSSNALDVGVSLRDPNAWAHVFITEDLLRYGSPPGPSQRGLRNREMPPLFLHYCRFNNALPMSPSEAVERAEVRESMKLGEGEQLPKHLIHHLAKRESLKTLAENQIDTYISHYWQKAGYEIKIQQPPKPQEATVAEVKDRKRDLTGSEKDAVSKRAMRILDNIEVMSEAEIQRKGEQAQLEPIPTEQLAHETANASLQETGWDGIVERMGSDGKPLPVEAVFADVKPPQWQCAKDLIQAEKDEREAGVDASQRINAEKVRKQRRGFIGVHFAVVSLESEEQDREDAQLSFIHRQHDGLMATLLTALLMFLPHNSPQTLNEVAPKVHHVFTVHYQGYSLAHWMVKGGFGDAEAPRFLNWGPDAEITRDHLDWISKFLATYYPARLAIQKRTVNDNEQIVCLLVQSTDAPLVVKVIRCYLTHAHPEVDLDSEEHRELFPSQQQMPYQFEAELAQARQMRTDGVKVEDIAEATGMSVGWVSKRTADIVPERKQIQQQAAREMDKQNKSHRSIAKKLGVSHHTVKKWLG